MSPVPPAVAGQDQADPGGEQKAQPGAPHVLAIRALDERLCWLRALGSRRKRDITGAVPARFRACW